MTTVIPTPFDWVPELPRGYVRDLRVRWALVGGLGGVCEAQRFGIV